MINIDANMHQWASRHACKIHPSTGAIQIIPFNTQSEAAVEVAEKPIEAGLFKAFNQRQLLDIGVPIINWTRTFYLAFSRLELM